MTGSAWRRSPILVEDNDKLIRFSLAGQLIEEKRKPENSVWFVPVGDRHVAKNMVVSGTPTQIIRVVIYDARLREVKELYRQPGFQQRQGNGFSYLRHNAASKRWEVHAASVPDGYLASLRMPNRMSDQR